MARAKRQISFLCRNCGRRIVLYTPGQEVRHLGSGLRACETDAFTVAEVTEWKEVAGGE